MLHSRTDVTPLFILREATGFFRFGFNDLLAEPLDCSGLIRPGADLQIAIFFLDLGELLLRKFSTVFRNGALLLKIEKMPTVRRKRLYKIDRD